MNRWTIAWGVVIAAVLLVLCFHSRSQDLLLDSDTSVLLRTIHQRNAPFSWFWSDWPLYNHFYRPIPTLTFELDSRLYGSNSVGYGWTNAIWAGGSVMALFWLLREVLDDPIQSMTGAVIFALWQTAFPSIFLVAIQYLAYAVLIIGIFRHRKAWRNYVPAFFTLLLLEQIFAPLEYLNSRMLDWLPGRTASTMTLFALIAMAAYSRFERIGASKHEGPVATSTDRPATKSSRNKKRSKLPRSTWIAVSLFATVGAFSCYEQAVMLPACLLGLAVYFAILNRRVNWWLQGAFWLVLVAYLGVRHQVIPPGESSYQAQQIKSGFVGPRDALLDLIFPPFSSIRPLVNELDGGIYIFFDSNFLGNIWIWFIYVVGLYELRRVWKVALVGWLLPFIAFMPMAFVKMFEHYYYWPMALRTILVIATGIVAASLTLTAVSPPKLQAPRRLDPAPGSLLGQ